MILSFQIFNQKRNMCFFVFEAYIYSKSGINVGNPNSYFSMNDIILNVRKGLINPWDQIILMCSI